MTNSIYSVDDTSIYEFVTDMLDYCAHTYMFNPRIVSGHSELLIGSWHGYTIYGCRGTTKNYSDILADMRAIPTKDFDLGWVHKGFLGASHCGILGLWGQIKHRIGNRGPGNCIFVGHSKGGAEATGLAALASMYHGPIAGLVTCGCPRVGFSLEAKINAKTIIRLVNGNDIVPRHPYPIWGYRHVADEFHIGGEGSGDRFVDHKMQHYIDSWEAIPHST